MNKDNDVNAIARVCHEVNREICAVYDDRSQVPWDDAPADIKGSAILGVYECLKNPTISPAALHEHWCQTKRAQGWSYGPIKDAQRKTHPCLVPYADLPLEQRLKDHVFRAIVRAMAH